MVDDIGFFFTEVLMIGMSLFFYWLSTWADNKNEDLTFAFMFIVFAISGLIIRVAQ